MLRNRKWILAALVIWTLILPFEALAKIRTRVAVRFGPPVRHHHSLHYRPSPVRVIRHTRINHGTVDFNVQPQKSKIYVNGHYLGIADQFNGFPQTAALPAGYHDIRIESPSGQVARERIYVAAGRELNFNLKF